MKKKYAKYLETTPLFVLILLLVWISKCRDDILLN